MTELERLLDQYGTRAQRRLVEVAEYLWPLAILPLGQPIPKGRRGDIETFLTWAKAVVADWGGDAEDMLNNPYAIHELRPVEPGDELQWFHMLEARVFQCMWSMCRLYTPAPEVLGDLRDQIGMLGGGAQEFAASGELDRAEQLLALFVELIPSVGLSLRESEAQIRSRLRDDPEDRPFDYEQMFSWYVLVLSDFCDAAIKAGQPAQARAQLRYFEALERADLATQRGLQGWRHASMRAGLALAEGHGEEALEWAQRGRELVVDDVSELDTALVLDEVESAISGGLPGRHAHARFGEMLGEWAAEMERIEAGEVALDVDRAAQMIGTMRALMRELPDAAQDPGLSFKLAWLEFGLSGAAEQLPRLRELARAAGREEMLDLVEVGAGTIDGDALDAGRLRAALRVNVDARVVHKALANLPAHAVTALWPDYLDFVERRLDKIERRWAVATPDQVASDAASKIPSVEEMLLMIASVDDAALVEHDDRKKALIRRLFEQLCAPTLRRQAAWKPSPRPPWLAELGRQLSEQLADREFEALARTRRELQVRCFGLRRDAPAIARPQPPRQLPELMLTTCGPMEGNPDIVTVSCWAEAGVLGPPETSPLLNDLPHHTDELLATLRPSSRHRGQMRECAKHDADDEPFEVEVDDERAELEALVATGKFTVADFRGDSFYTLRFGETFRRELPEIFGVRAGGLAQRVPFPAIVVDDHHWLGERALAILLTGLGDPDEQLRPLDDPAHALIVAIPRYAGVLPDIPGTAAEARQIREILGPGGADLLGSNASRDALIDALERDPPEILHIAAHGIADEAHSERSFLALAGDGRRAMTVLGFDEITTLDLSRTRLVVLSACSTMAGQRRRSEGILALSWAFKAAGVDMVIAARWPVVDPAAPAYWAVFYSELAEHRDVPRAMLAAQRSMIRSREWWDPSIWAGYQLIV